VGLYPMSRLRYLFVWPRIVVFSGLQKAAIAILMLLRSEHSEGSATVRNGFVPASRRQVFDKIRHLVSPTMPSLIRLIRTSRVGAMNSLPRR
jgi:hypothetical protein